jgi:hypothetical protein
MSGSPDRAAFWQALGVLALLVAAALPLAGEDAAPAGAALSLAPTASPAEWPRSWEGSTLRPLAFTPVEQRFARGFPGRIGRFDAGEFVLVLREAREPTRKLHPAADCYRGLGYAIEAVHVENDAGARPWRCFLARRDGRTVRVCERIEDAAGATFTDTSAWFWAAALGRSRGPWRAVTRVEPG